MDSIAVDQTMKSIFNSQTEVNGITLESDQTMGGTWFIKATTPDGEEYRFIHNREAESAKPVSWQSDVPEAVVSAIESKGVTVNR